MADIQSLLNVIQKAIYGKDMRSALHDAIKVLSDNAGDIDGIQYLGCENIVDAINKTYSELLDKNRDTNVEVGKKIDKADVGKLDELKTTEKETVVGAVNELNSRIDDLNDEKVSFDNYPETAYFPDINDTQYRSGVVKVDNLLNMGGLKVDANGFLKIQPASEDEIDDRTKTCKPITPSNLEYAIHSFDEIHTHDNKDMLDKIVYIDAYPSYSTEDRVGGWDGIDFSAFDNMESEMLYCIDVKESAVWDGMVDNATIHVGGSSQSNDFRPGMGIYVSVLELGANYTEHFYILMAVYNVSDITNTYEATRTITAMQYFTLPNGDNYSRQIQKEIDLTTGEQKSLTYSDFSGRTYGNIVNGYKTEVANAIRDLGVLYRYRGTADAKSDIRSNTSIGNFSPGDVYNIGNDFGNDVQIILQSKLGGVFLSGEEEDPLFVVAMDPVRAYFSEYFDEDKEFSAWIEFDGVSGTANVSFGSLVHLEETLYFDTDEDEKFVRENKGKKFAIHLNAFIPVKTGDNIVYTPEGLWDKLSADLSKYTAMGANAKATSGGGAVGDGAIAEGGGAVGNGAKAEKGGGAVGCGAFGGNCGGAVGYNAKTDGGGGAVGNDAWSNGGGAVGLNAKTNNGFSGGYNAKSTYGGAVGSNAVTLNGFAGGEGAKTQNTDGDAIDAIQLGTGTNSNKKTLQAYDYQVTKYDEENDVSYLKDVGKVDDLKTTEKETVVGAVNELYHSKTSRDELIAVQEELNDKVSFTDYATNSKPGVVLAQEKYSSGIAINSFTGVITLAEAPEEMIDKRIGACAITVPTLDYAVRSVKPEVVEHTIEHPAPAYITVNAINNIVNTPEDVYIILAGSAYQAGDFAQVNFYSGATPPTLTIQAPNGLTDIDLIPEANTAYSLYFEYGLISITDGTPKYRWRFSYAEYPYTEV